MPIPNNPPTPVAEDLQAYADRVAMLADEVERIEGQATADEITYQLRDGEVAIIELAYYLTDDTDDTD